MTVRLVLSSDARKYLLLFCYRRSVYVFWSAAAQQAQPADSYIFLFLDIMMKQENLLSHLCQNIKVQEHGGH